MVLKLIKLTDERCCRILLVHACGFVDLIKFIALDLADAFQTLIPCSDIKFNVLNTTLYRSKLEYQSMVEVTQCYRYKHG